MRTKRDLTPPKAVFGLDFRSSEGEAEPVGPTKIRQTQRPRERKLSRSLLFNNHDVLPSWRSLCWYRAGQSVSGASPSLDAIKASMVLLDRWPCETIDTILRPHPASLAMSLSVIALCLSRRLIASCCSRSMTDPDLNILTEIQSEVWNIHRNASTCILN